MTNSLKDLKETVVGNGYCIGCGSCSFASNSEIKMVQNKFGMYTANITSNNLGEDKYIASKVCPFSDESKTENELGEINFPDSNNWNEYLGNFKTTYAGHVKEGEYRSSGSSGGFTTWILQELLREDLIDFVVHVRPRRKTESSSSSLFHYTISSNYEELREGAKSHYHTVELSGVLQQIKDTPGRYAVVGIPCFIKSIRLLQIEDEDLRSRIKFCIGLFCGHLKSPAFAQLFAWQCGVQPASLTKMDFRVKQPGKVATEYAIEATGEVSNGEVCVSQPTSMLFGSNWGHGLFKPKACDFCDDVVGETSDVSIGDAWLPEYEHDSHGTNAIIVRNDALDDLISKARNSGRLKLDDISPDRVMISQAGGFRHKRQGLAYRLQLEDTKREWRPKKRVQPSANSLSSKQKRIQRLRISLSALSHTAFKDALDNNNLQLFFEKVLPLSQQLDRLTRPSFLTRVRLKLHRAYRKLTKREA